MAYSLRVSICSTAKWGQGAGATQHLAVQHNSEQSTVSPLHLRAPNCKTVPNLQLVAFLDEKTEYSPEKLAYKWTCAVQIHVIQGPTLI